MRGEGGNVPGIHWTATYLTFGLAFQAGRWLPVVIPGSPLATTFPSPTVRTPKTVEQEKLWNRKAVEQVHVQGFNPEG